jgi:hypothetical protein
MPTYDLLTDNPTTYPTQVRSPDGSAARNATTEAGGLQDLANRTAYLKSRIGNIIGSGTTAAMKAITVASVGDLFFVDLVGWYSYSASGTPQSPWIENATGIGSGAWVHDSMMSLLDAGAPARLVDSVMKYPQLVQSFLAGDAAHGNSDYLAYTLTNSLSPVVDHNSGTLSVALTGLHTGDLVDFDVGPLIVANGSGSPAQVLQFNLEVTQTGLSGGVTNYPIPLAVGASQDWRVLYIPASFTSASTSTATFTLQANFPASGGAIASIQNPGIIGGSALWGPYPPYIWGRVKIWRQF